jgi:hypothetical protein
VYYHRRLRTSPAAQYRQLDTLAQRCNGRLIARHVLYVRCVHLCVKIQPIALTIGKR